MHIDFFLDRFREAPDKDAIIWQGKIFSYGWLLEAIDEWQGVISAQKIPPGSIAVLDADFSPNSIALFLALIEHACVVVPLTSAVENKKTKFIETAQGEFSLSLQEDDHFKVDQLSVCAEHELYDRLRQLDRPGLVLFSSGSTGESKGVVHDFSNILEKFTVRRKALRTITFLLFDHIGGVNTLLYVLSNGGCVVTLQDRSPDAVLKAIEQYQVELLPTSPTFINLILLSEAYQRYNLECLKLVTYGTEPMPQSTLKRFHQVLPNTKLLQTYGLSEIGILRSKSRSSDSLWVKIGGEDFKTRVVDGILQIKAKSAMLGYLNFESPFTADGWLDTGDRVEIDGEFIRFLGRDSEIINVGGEKVYPAEVESTIQEIDNVAEATVYGEKNPITGNITCAKVSLMQEEDPKSFVARLKKHCAGKLERFKVPVKVKIMNGAQHSQRFKKIRY